MKFYGAIEAGGTKFVCAVSDEQLNLIECIKFSTTTPDETLNLVFDFFDSYNLISVGIGAFGPIDINPKSPTYGYITSTPKLDWQNYDFLGTFKNRYKIPVGFTTDVNAAALGEQRLGAAKGLDSCVYLTVGTGIGGGVVVNGEILVGHSHPEMGHILVRIHPDEKFEGLCPFHNNCLEGLAAGPAIEKRTGVKGYELPIDHPVWQIEAYYLAQAIMNYILILSPEKIILGGGIMKQRQLFPLIRQELANLLNDYVLISDLKNYIVPPFLEDNAGITGCLLLAIDVAKI